MQDELKQSILCGSTIQVNGTINCQAEIHSKIARKWLNSQDISRKMYKKEFFDGYEREDMVEYQKTFLEEMKLLLPYFVEFQDNGIIFYKEY